MTLEEREEAYHKEMKERIFKAGKTEWTDQLTARAIFIRHIQEAQHEAVEKTKQACWEWLKALSLPEHFVEEGEEITLSTYFSKNEFLSEFIPEKLLSQREKE